MIRKYCHPLLRRQSCCFRILLFFFSLFFSPSCQLHQGVAEQCEDEEAEVAAGAGDPGSQALGVAVVGVAAVHTHPGRPRSVPPRPLAEGPERAGLHDATCNRATVSPQGLPNGHLHPLSTSLTTQHHWLLLTDKWIQPQQHTSKLPLK